MKRQFVVVSVTAAFLLLPLFPLHAQEDPAGDTPQSPRPGLSRMERMLDLTAEQKSRLEELRKARLQQTAAQREEMRELGQELAKLRDDPKADLKAIDSLVDRITQLRGEQMKARLRMHKDLQSILTSEQLEKMRDLRTRLGRMRQASRFHQFLHRGGRARSPRTFQRPLRGGMGFGTRLREHRVSW